MDDVQHDRVNFTLSKHEDDQLAKRFGAGWYYTFEDTELKTGPFESETAAHAAAVELVEQSVAAALVSALFGFGEAA